MAAPLTEKLQVTKEDGKKGSQKALLRDSSEVRAFNDLKAALGRALSICQMQVDKPFILHTDASVYAMGCRAGTKKRQTNRSSLLLR